MNAVNKRLPVQLHHLPPHRPRLQLFPARPQIMLVKNECYIRNVGEKLQKKLLPLSLEWVGMCVCACVSVRRCVGVGVDMGFCGCKRYVLNAFQSLENYTCWLAQPSH